MSDCNFVRDYKQLCTLKHLVVQRHIISAVQADSLVIKDATRITADADWLPLFRLLKERDYGFARISISRFKPPPPPLKAAISKAVLRNSNLNRQRSQATPKKVSKHRKSFEWALELTKALQDHLLKSTRVRVLELNGIDLNAECLSRISAGLSTSISLKTLSISGCDVGLDGLKVLAPGMRACPCLQYIQLNHCRMDNSCLEFLLAIIKNQAALRAPAIWEQSLRDDFRKKLPEATTIFRLDLAENSLNDGAVDVLCDMYDDTPGLHALDLRGNSLSNEGLRKVLDLVKKHEHLIFLDVRSIAGADVELASDIDKALLENVNKHLQGLHFSPVANPMDLWKSLNDDCLKYHDIAQSIKTMKANRPTLKRTSIRTNSSASLQSSKKSSQPSRKGSNASVSVSNSSGGKSVRTSIAQRSESLELHDEIADITSTIRAMETQNVFNSPKISSKLERLLLVMEKNIESLNRLVDHIEEE